MAVEFKDYYRILGVPRSATQEEIKRAFRELARSCHPDLARAGDKVGAEARFKEVNEAYEVLRNTETRAKYDRLSADWKRRSQQAGVRYAHSSPSGASGPSRPSSGGYEFRFGGTGFSEFFERFFSDAGGIEWDDVGLGTAFEPPSGSTRGRRAKGADIEAELLVTLEEASRGAIRRITVSKAGDEAAAQGVETLEVRIPAGVREGQRIRLSGRGQPSPAGGPPGDLYLKTRFAQHPYFKVKGSDLHYELALAPWEAVLGTTVVVPTLHGSAKLKVKPGAKEGRQLRLKGHGLPNGAGGRGDLLAETRIHVPTVSSEEETALWVQLRDRSRFNPRDPNQG